MDWNYCPGMYSLLLHQQKLEPQRNYQRSHSWHPNLQPPHTSLYQTMTTLHTSLLTQNLGQTPSYDDPVPSTTEPRIKFPN